MTSEKIKKQNRKIRQPHENPAHFQRGERVRIYRGYPAHNQISVREGTVLNYRRKLIDGKSKKESLILRVEAAGILVQEGPFNVLVINPDRNYRARGNLKDVNSTEEYVDLFMLKYIYGAEKIE